MTHSIDQLKGLISSKGGMAKANMFRVILPPIRGIDAREVNLLCKATNIPGRQIMTHERTIGIKTQKVAYGFTKEEVNMTFHILNDYGIRNYFEQWQNAAVNMTTYEVGYKADYALDVKIQQLKPGFSLPIYSTNENTLFDIDLDFITSDQVVYECTLQNAFPTTLNAIELNNDPNGIVELNVQMSYEDWKNSAIEPEDTTLSDSILATTVGVLTT